MAEVMTIDLLNSGPWDGSTPVEVDRDGQRGPHYTFAINGGGMIGADLLGLVTPHNLKVVSLAIDSDVRGVVARVTSPDSPDPGYRELELSPRWQRVEMAGGSVLRIVWSSADRAPRMVKLLVQDMGEMESTRYMQVEHRPERIMSRFVLRNTSQFGIGGTPLDPDWQFESDTIREALVSGDGFLTLRDFVSTKINGVYVWVKFFGVPLGGTLGVVGTQSPYTNEVFEFSPLANEKWSDPIWLSANDRLAFKTLPPAAGSPLGVVIDVSPIRTRRIGKPAT